MESARSVTNPGMQRHAKSRRVMSCLPCNSPGGTGYDMVRQRLAGLGAARLSCANPGQAGFGSTCRRQARHGGVRLGSPCRVRGKARQFQVRRDVVRLGSASLGISRLCETGHDAAGQGLARLGFPRYGLKFLARNGKARRGLAHLKFGVTRHGATCQDAARWGMVFLGRVRRGWGMTWFVMASLGVVRLGFGVIGQGVGLALLISGLGSSRFGRDSVRRGLAFLKFPALVRLGAASPGIARCGMSRHGFPSRGECGAMLGGARPGKVGLPECVDGLGMARQRTARLSTLTMERVKFPLHH